MLGLTSEQAEHADLWAEPGAQATRGGSTAGLHSIFAQHFVLCSSQALYIGRK